MKRQGNENKEKRRLNIKVTDKGINKIPNKERSRQRNVSHSLFLSLCTILLLSFFSPSFHLPYLSSLPPSLLAAPGTGWAASPRQSITHSRARDSEMKINLHQYFLNRERRLERGQERGRERGRMREERAITITIIRSGLTRNVS